MTDYQHRQCGDCGHFFPLPESLTRLGAVPIIGDPVTGECRYQLAMSIVLNRAPSGRIEPQMMTAYPQPQSSCPACSHFAEKVEKPAAFTLNMVPVDETLQREMEYQAAKNGAVS